MLTCRCLPACRPSCILCVHECGAFSVAGALQEVNEVSKCPEQGSGKLSGQGRSVQTVPACRYLPQECGDRRPADEPEISRHPGGACLCHISVAGQGTQSPRQHDCGARPPSRVPNRTAGQGGLKVVWTANMAYRDQSVKARKQLCESIVCIFYKESILDCQLQCLRTTLVQLQPS